MSKKISGFQQQQKKKLISNELENLSRESQRALKGARRGNDAKQRQQLFLRQAKVISKKFTQKETRIR